ncbi:DUF559 domain-containing protein [Legionella moravica]
MVSFNLHANLTFLQDSIFVTKRQEQVAGRRNLNCQQTLIFEIDGGQQNECRQNEYDNRRTNSLNNSGYEILRFWSNEVQQQLNLVMDVI